MGVLGRAPRFQKRLAWTNRAALRPSPAPAEPIPARRRVIEYTGQRIGRAEVFRRRFRQHIYIHWLPTGRAIDGAIGGSGAEYLNHSCVPNLIARCTRTRIFLTSLRPIAAGEELFFDYRIANNGYDIPCKCGHPDCIGVLNPVR